MSVYFGAFTESDEEGGIVAGVEDGRRFSRELLFGNWGEEFGSVITGDKANENALF